MQTAMSVSVSLSVRTHISETARPNVIKFSAHAVTQSSPGGEFISYVLPVLCMTVCFAAEDNGRQEKNDSFWQVMQGS